MRRWNRRFLIQATIRPMTTTVKFLFDYPDHPTVEEIRGFLESLNEDEATELLALVWVGRGDFDIDEWDEAVIEARESPEERRLDAFSISRCSRTTWKKA